MAHSLSSLSLPHSSLRLPLLRTACASLSIPTAPSHSVTTSSPTLLFAPERSVSFPPARLIRAPPHPQPHRRRHMATSAALLPPGAMAALSAAAVAAAAAALFMRWNGRWYERQCDVVAGASPLIQNILDHLLPIIQPYRPALPHPNEHLETIFAAVMRTKPDVVFQRECLHMPDGGTVALDWPLPLGCLSHLPAPAPCAPVLILLPGLTGGSGDSYVRHLLVRARRDGWNAMVFNSRGCADSPVTSPQFYSASFTEDLRGVVRHVGSVFPGSRLYAAGWSLGANILVRYLGQEGSHTPLSGAISLCNPFDLVLADRNFHIGFNNFYDQRLAVSLNKIFSRHASLFEGIGGDYNIDLVKRAKSVREFDDGLTRVSFGYPSVDHYYADASSSRSIKHVRIPLLCIQAEDDPIAPVEGIPVKDIMNNPHCLLITTPYGGHLGWVAGDEAPFGAPWTDVASMKFLARLDALLAAPSEEDEQAGDGHNGSLRSENGAQVSNV